MRRGRSCTLVELTPHPSSCPSNNVGSHPSNNSGGRADSHGSNCSSSCTGSDGSNCSGSHWASSLNESSHSRGGSRGGSGGCAVKNAPQGDRALRDGPCDRSASAVTVQAGGRGPRAQRGGSRGRGGRRLCHGGPGPGPTPTATGATWGTTPSTSTPHAAVAVPR